MMNEEREKEIRKLPIPNKEECIAFYEELTKLADVRFVPYYKMAIKALEQQPCEDVEEYGLNQQMTFPETFEEFAKEFGFKDDKEVYTNGSDLIPIFRVKQWLEQNMANESIKALDKLDSIIVEQLDKSTDFKECMTLRWVLDKIAEVEE